MTLPATKGSSGQAKGSMIPQKHKQSVVAAKDRQRKQECVPTKRQPSIEIKSPQSSSRTSTQNVSGSE